MYFKKMPIIIFIIEMVLMYALGCWVGIHNTLKYQKPYTEDNNTIIIEAYGQEWVYEE